MISDHKGTKNINGLRLLATLQPQYSDLIFTACSPQSRVGT
jgi:hypothetical protein